MRFDLEIQPSSIGIIFVEQGNNIPNSTVPILYTNVNETNIVPQDLVEIELASKFKTYMNLPVTQQNSLVFNTDTNKIMITNIAGFSKVTGTKYPIFYKHTIKHSAGKKILDQSIKVFNEMNTRLDNELFVITSGDNETYLYVNPVDGSVLFVEYGDDEKTYREMVKLEPVFRDASSDYLIPNYTLGTYEFAVTPTGSAYQITTVYGGTKFVASQKDFAIVKPPIGNINEGWNLRLENVTFTETMSGIPTTFHIVEYDLFRLTNTDFYTTYTDQISKILNKRYIKLQTPPAIETISGSKTVLVDIKIKDKATGDLVYAFTTDKASEKKNTSVTGIVWNLADDYNYNGVIKLPIDIDVTLYDAYATYKVENSFYVYKMLDMNSLDSSHARMIGIYIIPYNASDDTVQQSVYYAFIGTKDDRPSSEKYMFNGSGFDTKQDYETFLIEHRCFNICYTSVSVDKLHKLLDVSNCSYKAETVTDEYTLALEHIDLFKRDIINEDIQLHLNDVVYAHIDSNIFTGNSTKDEEYITFAKDVVSKNANVSSATIVGKNLVRVGI